VGGRPRTGAAEITRVVAGGPRVRMLLVRRERTSLAAGAPVAV